MKKTECTDFFDIDFRAKRAQVVSEKICVICSKSCQVYWEKKSVLSVEFCSLHFPLAIFGPIR